MTRIEADAVLGAPPPEVWRLLIDHQRWPEWFAPPAAPATEADASRGIDGGSKADRGSKPDATGRGATGRTSDGRGKGAGGGLRVDAVTLVRGAPDGVGSLRECTATLGPLPLPFPWTLGRRHVRWTDRVADVHRPWLLELDVVGGRRPFARARLRLILVEAGPGQTRLRLRLSYAPGFLWPLDALWLRRAAGAGLRTALAGLAARYEAPVTAPPQDAAPAARPNDEVDPQEPSRGREATRTIPLARRGAVT